MRKGAANCITDVAGVKVGHVTLHEKLNEEETICTGVTAILPHSGNLFMKKTPAASYVINGYGKTCGLVQVDELGVLESPIMLTNTFSVGDVLRGTMQYMLSENPEIGDRTSSLNIVVGECNDSYLNSMRLMAVQPEHAIEAIKRADSAPVEEGAAGAGKGMMCFGYKGGIGTASRIVQVEDGTAWTVGILVLSNFGKREESRFADWAGANPETPDGSIIIVLATDAPLYDRQLRRLAKRCTIGLGRTGSHVSHGSGDIVIAFSTAELQDHSSPSSTGQLTYIREDRPAMNGLFRAAAEATEEAIFRSLLKAQATEGRLGRTAEKAPLAASANK